MGVKTSDKLAKKIVECLFIGVISSAFTIFFGYISDKKMPLTQHTLKLTKQN